MNVSLYQAAAAMNAAARWQDVISENLAVGSTPGGRARGIAISSVQSNPQFVIPAANTTVDFEQGDMRATGNPLDFALQGKGFFEVQLPNGSKAYTRDGEFHLNSQGQLTTKQGWLVMSESGTVQSDPGNPKSFTVAATGEISQGSEPKGKLKLVEFNDAQRLTQLSSGYFRADDPDLKPTSSTSTQVQQGSLEGSNISPTAQMASLIAAMRTFESNQKVVQMQDDRMGREITDLGNPN